MWNDPDPESTIRSDLSDQVLLDDIDDVDNPEPLGFDAGPDLSERVEADGGDVAEQEFAVPDDPENRPAG